MSSYYLLIAPVSRMVVKRQHKDPTLTEQQVNGVWQGVDKETFKRYRAGDVVAVGDYSDSTRVRLMEIERELKRRSLINE